jgi:large subunit ribosomal protein L28
MSRRCFVCKKGSISGNRVSHSNRKTKRIWLPNLQKIRIIYKGTELREYVCTKCMKAGKVKKAA